MLQLALFSCFAVHSLRTVAMLFNISRKLNEIAYTNLNYFFFVDLLPFAKLWELLAINHIVSERRIIFVPRLLKFSHVLVVL